MDNNVEVINVAYDKWILRAPEGSLGPRLCEKPMRRLGGVRGSLSVRPRPSRAVNQCSGLHQWCQHSGHNTSRWAAERRLPPWWTQHSVSRERTPLMECLPACLRVSVFLNIRRYMRRQIYQNNYNKNVKQKEKAATIRTFFFTSEQDADLI